MVEEKIKKANKTRDQTHLLLRFLFSPFLKLVEKDLGIKMDVIVHHPRNIKVLLEEENRIRYPIPVHL